MSSPADADEDTEQRRRQERMRYHLGRGRRAREAGRYVDGAAEARQALAATPRDGWSLALLGQCLSRQTPPDLAGARRVLENACALQPTNGYFVGLLLGVLDTQGDAQGRADLLATAWWRGAPVDRWLPDGPPIRRSGAAASAASASAAAASAAADGVPAAARPEMREAEDTLASARRARAEARPARSAIRQPVGA